MSPFLGKKRGEDVKKFSLRSIEVIAREAGLLSGADVKDIPVLTASVARTRAISQARRINRSQRISTEHRSIDGRGRTVRLREQSGVGRAHR